MQPYRFTVEQYHRMIEMGILTENDRCELLEGWIVAIPRQSPPRAAVASLFGEQLLARMPEGWLVRIRCAVTTADSEPEPDVAVVQDRGSHYFRRHPMPGEIAMIVEVSDYAGAAGWELRRRVYARAGVPAYWYVSLPESRIEVYRRPRAGRSPGYLQRLEYGKEALAPLRIGRRTLGQILVRELLP